MQQGKAFTSMGGASLSKSDKVCFSGLVGSIVFSTDIFVAVLNIKQNRTQAFFLTRDQKDCLVPLGRCMWTYSY